MKYDAQKIKDIAKRLGVSEATVRQYLHTRVAMVDEISRGSEPKASAPVDRNRSRVEGPSFLP